MSDRPDLLSQEAWGYLYEALERARVAEARVRGLEEALRIYADPRHWAIRRGEFREPTCVWIGPHSYQPFPDAPGVAREALES